MPLLPTYYYKWELKLTGTENVLVSYIQAGEILDFFSRKTDKKLAMFQKKNEENGQTILNLLFRSDYKNSTWTPLSQQENFGQLVKYFFKKSDLKLDYIKVFVQKISSRSQKMCRKPQNCCNVPSFDKLHTSWPPSLFNSKKINIKY